MAQTNEHGRIIAATAKTALVPLGFQRKGASRIWFADNGYWLLVVEFQPSGWSKGSYLNVATHWLWSSISDGLQVVLSFDYGGRAAGFISFESEAQFLPQAASLADIAAAESVRLSGLLVSIEAIADCLIAEERQASDEKLGGQWGAFHAGIAAALAGKSTTARTMFDAILVKPPLPGSVLHSMAQRMSDLLDDSVAFRRHVFGVIDGQREKLKLPPFNTGPLT